MFYLSQAHLQRYVKCPPDFQQVYLKQLANPTDPDQLEKQEWGTRFHLAMQQLQLGFALDKIVADQELKTAVQSLLVKIPDFFKPQPEELSEAEYRRTLAVNNFLLTIICDWVVFKKDTLEIYDWKTYRKPQKSDYLKHHWQTKLYLYLLAETTTYQPKQISMTYWFVKSGEEPQSSTFKYTQVWHEKIQQELTEILTRLEQDLAAYFERNLPLHHHDRDSCPICLKQGLSHYQDVQRSPELATLLAGKTIKEFVAEIEEIPI